MSRNLLSEITSRKVYSPIGTFATVEAVTITVYKNGSGTPEAITTPTCTELASTGIYYFDLAGLDSAPTTLSEYYWVMGRTIPSVLNYSPQQPILFGGYVESFPQALDAADECRVTVNLYKIGGGINPINPETLFDTALTNHIQLLAKFHDGSRYFKLEKIKPSYAQDVAQAFWVLPRNSIVDVELQSFGLTKETKTVPDQATIDIFDWLNP